jgi:hypothetical protein
MVNNVPMQGDIIKTDNEMEARFERRGYNERQKELFRNVMRQRAELYSNPELCLQRMRERKIILDYIPGEWWQNLEFCREAVKAWDDALEYIPEEYVKLCGEQNDDNLP